MKYIVTIDENKKEDIFTFPNNIDHDHMAEVLCHIRRRVGLAYWVRDMRVPVSAGFVEKGKCVGRSITLGLSSRKEDTKLLEGTI